VSIVSEIFKGGAEGVFSGIRGIIGAFKGDPTVKLQLEAAIAQAQITLEAQVAQAEATILTAVNATMQAEAKSEHWLQWSWRPLVGYSFVGTIANNYILLPYFQKYLTPITIPAEVFYAWLAILGVTAGFRGMEKWQKTRNGTGGNGK